MAEPVVAPELQSMLNMQRAQDVFRGEALPRMDSRVFIGDDIVMQTGEITLAPGGFTSAKLFIPRGYFQGLVPLELERYLLDVSVVGVPDLRSRLCQAGLYAYRNDPNFNPGKPDVEEEGDHYVMHLLIHNSHPTNSLHFPAHGFEAARLAIFPPALQGIELYQMAREFNDPSITIVGIDEDGKYTAYSMDDLNRLSLEEISVLNLLSISLKLEGMSLLRNRPRRVSIEDIISEKAVDRASVNRYKKLYRYLGTKWQGFSERRLRSTLSGRRAAQLTLLSTKGVKVPRGCVLKTINPAHTPATIIDAGFNGPIILELPVMMNAHELDELGLGIDWFTFFAYKA